LLEFSSGCEASDVKKADLKHEAAQYLKFVEWSDEDETFIGRCPALFDGGIHGRDEARVYRELCEAAEEWVRVLADDGTELPQNGSAQKFSGRFLVRVDPALHRRLAAKARLAGESLNTFVGKALSRGG